MIKKLHIGIILLFFFMSFAGFATHVVGGSLTYVYNGGSNYTITLKLYRDCGPGTAALPANVTIQIVGYNGQPFTPSKNVTINLTSVTNIAATLDPCAIPPNPAPCVEEAVYTTTVNNLPPNAGGYHMYFQICCRNGSILNITNPGGTGETYYAHIPGMSLTTNWNEDFTLPNNTTTDNGATSWSITPGAIAPASASVNGNVFQIAGANNAGETWTSQPINIASCASVNLSTDLSEAGTLDANDSIFVFYRLNGGALIPFTTNGVRVDDFGNVTATTTGLVGTTVQIVIRVHFDGNSPNSEIYSFDNITTTCVGNDFMPNSNPVFNLFPPLFICVNQPFSFNHAATDINGDSLVYSLYQPYNNIAPTFTNNTANFPLVNYVGGYNFSNPLGGGPFSINSSTGLLTGTPGTLGQFVVGVLVKEYRNGIYIGETLRDFQFNVVNCPQPPPTLAVANATVNNGCSSKLTATGVTQASTTWTSIFPGAPGAYNNYLACTNACLSNTVTAPATGTPPAFVDYVVCGVSTSCAGNFICDTFRVTFNPTLLVNIFPSNPTLCFGQTSTTITAVGGGGTPGYTYLWNNVNPSQTINVGVGTYNVQLSDASGCPPVFKSVTVTAFTTAITANAGSNVTRCIQSPVATISGSVTGASGGIWSGGNGTYTPNNTTLANLSYSPTPAELASGSVNLILTTTGNGTCPLKTDTVKINYVGFTGTATPSVTNVSCFGSIDGIATMNLTGGFPPYTYFWNTSPTQTTSTASNLPIGTYSVNIQDAIGCTYQTTVNITQPPVLAINSITKNVSCFGTSTGSISATPTGGTAPYTYSWSPGAQTTSSITGLAIGNYTVKVTDSRGCIKTATYSLTQPPVIAATFTQTNVTCFNANNGSVNASVTGGTSPYTYNWLPGGSTSQNATGLQAGTYTLTITDNANCIITQTVAITQPSVLTSSTSITNETCNYLNNGSATVTATGGTGPYTYSWQPGGQTTISIANLASGNYSVTATDSKGCQSSAVATISQPTPLTVSFINQMNVSCFGGSNASIGASPSGGTPNYTYSWTPGGVTTSTISNIPIGTYTVKVTDVNSCLITNTVTITQSADIVISNTVSNAGCNGTSSGSITVSASGGNGPFTYGWLPGGQTTASVTGLAAGNYTVNVTDINGCPKTATYTITQPTLLNIALTQTNVSCFGGSNGVANAFVTGGTSPYTYTWSPTNLNTPMVTGLGAITYTVNVKDANNCLRSNTLTISQPLVIAITSSVTDETCNTLNNGTASVTTTGGTAPYTYSWSPGGITTPTVSNLAAGLYTAMVTDSKGCVQTKTITITEPSPLNVSFNNIVNPKCFGGNNGSIGSTVTGGTPIYSYTWSPGNQNTGSLINISAGTYTLNVKDSKGCIAQNTITITQPSSITVTATSQSVTCFGLSNGASSANSSGGTPGYTYTWTPGGLTGQNVTNLSSGTYTINTEDANNCVTSGTVFVSQPAQITAVITTTSSTCGNANGIASLNVSGGVGPYTYSWVPNGGTASVSTGLLAGSYNAIITDANSCQESILVSINDLGGPVASIFSITNVSCNGGNDGSVTASVVGGLAPITYSWSPYGGNGTTASGLTAGTYYITVTDANGCIALASTNPSISEPTAVTSIITTSNVSCFGGANGSATVTASNGTPGYTYTWLPGTSTGSVITGQNAGTYSVQIKDANNCILVSPYVITQPTAPISAALASTSVTCFGLTNGVLNALATGGTGPYNYDWLPGNYSGNQITNVATGTYSVKVTDANGCILTNSINVNGPAQLTLTTGGINSNCSLANGQASVTASGGTGAYSYTWTPGSGSSSIYPNLLPGTYNVQVSDANNCLATATKTVVDNPSQAVSVVQTASVSCFGGANASLTANVAGGTGPFTYTWMPSGGNNQIASGLTSNTYSVFVTSANGCLATATSSLIPQPSQLFTVITTSNVSCFAGANGSASVTAGGGIPGYTYSWLPGATTGTVVTSQSAGTYSINVTDANSCVLTSTYAITQPTAALNVSITSTAVACFAGSSGSANASVTGGTTPYTYNWLPMSINSPSVGGLAAGIYTLGITDFKNCTTSNTISITQPIQSLSATTNAVPISCSGGSNGTATVTPTGGTPGYTYQWAPSGGSAQSAAGLTPGTYFVTVTDANSCQTNVSINISSPTPVMGNLIVINPACGLANGSITSQISGGTGPYTYTWSPSSVNTSTINGLAPGSYTFQTMDAFNCPYTLTTNLINIPGPTVNVISTLNDSCFGGNNGVANIGINSGTLPYTINWLPFGGNTTTASQLTAGIYTANVVDGRGCLNTTTVTITEPALLSVAISSLVNVGCFNGNTGSISVLASGGTPNYSYTWSPSGTGSTINNLAAGTYTVKLTDSHFCATAISMSISQPTSALTSTITNVITLLCHNSTGSATSSVSGGTTPYTYTWTTVPIQNTNIATNMDSGTYTMTVSDANNCISSNTLTLTQPSQINSIGGLNDTICLGQSGIIMASATGGAGNYYYVWQPVNVTNSGTLNINPTTTTNYTVVAFDQNGCAGLPDTMKAVVFSLNPSNVQTFGQSPICPGQSSLISALVSGTTGPVTYSWDNGLGNTPGPHIVSPTQPTDYVVTVSNTCGSVVSDTVKILFNPQPTILASLSGTLACIPTPVNFFDNSVTGNVNDPITSWLWDFGDGTTSSSQNSNHVYTTTGAYTVNLTVTTDGGCTNNNASSPLVVYAYPHPNAAFDVNSTVFDLPYDVLNCTNQSNGATNYEWNFGDGGGSTEINPSHTYTSVGVYHVQLVAISQYGCTDTASVDIVTDADVVFPNAFTPNENGPSGGNYIPGSLNNDIFFPYTSGVVEYKFQIFDRWGELIFETENVKQGWDGYYRGKLCQLDVYIWKAHVVLNNGKVFNKKGDVTLLR
ncbi:MAG: PKD domain-containing protein [Bacteroidota bacterium]